MRLGRGKIRRRKPVDIRGNLVDRPGAERRPGAQKGVSRCKKKGKKLPHLRKRKNHCGEHNVPLAAKEQNPPQKSGPTGKFPRQRETKGLNHDIRGPRKEKYKKADGKKQAADKLGCLQCQARLKRGIKVSTPYSSEMNLHSRAYPKKKTVD